ncbi:MAG: AmmeMemoRadiSam system protein B [Deferribacterales bacterium]
MRRQAAVAGYFYPADKDGLTEFFKENTFTLPKKNALMVIVPHAGYVYSGATAFKTLSSVNIPEHVVIMGPNHSGAGAVLSVYPEGEWETPFGDAIIDEGIVNTLCLSGIFERDTQAHRREHSVEVIVPMLKFLRPDVKITCITVKNMHKNTLKSAAEVLFSSVRDKNALIVVSSDMNHFENAQITEQKDSIAIDALLKSDENMLYNSVFTNSISMCGIFPAYIGLHYCGLCGAHKAELVEHTHSGIVSGDFNSVVGYAGLIYSKVIHES